MSPRPRSGHRRTARDAPAPGRPRANSSESARRTRIRRKLASWYRRHHRALPWRATADPYAVWISELMLQQTTVRTVIPYFERFMRVFPDLPALARAPLEKVLQLWSGLGYYRRARQLHQAARLVMVQHDGRLPADPEALGQLPGVGRYTAGAILSIAFEKPHPVVDGNVTRVLARLEAIDGSPTRATTKRRLWTIATELLARRRPGEHNQALMELGAVICTPRQPDCPHCPIRTDCRAHQSDRVAELPAPAPRPATRRIRVATIVAHRRARRGRSVLLVQRPDDASLAGLWETPSLEIPAAASPDPAAIQAQIQRTTGLVLGPAVHLGHHHHAIMNRRIRLEVLAAPLAKRSRQRPEPRMMLVASHRIEEYPLTGMARKAIGLFLAGEDSA